MVSFRTVSSSCAAAGLMLGLALAWTMPTTMLPAKQTIVPAASLAGAHFPSAPEAPGYFSVPDVHAPLYTYVDGERRPVYDAVETGAAIPLPEPRSVYEAREPAAVPEGEETAPEMAVMTLDDSGAYAVRTALTQSEPAAQAPGAGAAAAGLIMPQ